MKFLLVNSDQDFIDNFQYSFKSEEYIFSSAKNIKDAISLISKNDYDLVVMDMTFKDGTGLDLKRKMNDIKDIPTIVVSKSKEPNDVVLALEYGCDDYVSIPFYLLELKARIRSILRRTAGQDIEDEYKSTAREGFVTKGIFEFNIVGGKVTIGSEEVDLTRKEFDLLYILVSNKNKIFTRRELADEIWKDISDSNIRTVDVHVRRLREKLQTTHADKYIQTQWGEGYYFDDQMSRGNN